MSWFYYVGRALTKAALFLLVRYEVRGKENIPRQGGVLIVCNHLHLADPAVLGVSFGRRVVFMAKEELFRSRLAGYFIREFGAFPVRRGQADREALRQARSILVSGQALIMFPEGMRSRSGQLRSAFPGSALIALHNGVPVLPVGITGTEKLRGRSWWLRRPRLTVHIGEPFHLPAPDGPSRIAREAHTHLIMQNIARLLPQEYRGSYGEGEDGQP
ncbi:MAG: 1-acyl-sn-glycerol-3-phosphate acyltransferase [Chloroflexi bacterium]|nr:1-acyl-sn-glycerol-3-phosphate acyltransferase [Chloroflexota bacterium]